MTLPLDPFSEVVDPDRKWRPDWYSWLQQLNRRMESFNTALSSLNTTVAEQNYGRFFVDRNGVNQVITGGVSDNFLVQFNHKVLDVNNLFDSTTNFRYTPDKAGWYYINLQTFADNAASETSEAVIYRNDAVISNPSVIQMYGTFSSGLTLSASSAVTASSTLVFLNGTTDYVEGWCFLPGTAASKSIYGSVIETRMFGWRVSS